MGEGIETCLAAQQLGYRPVWAVGSTAGIAQLPILPGLGALTIFGENDTSSNIAAETCGARYPTLAARYGFANPVTVT